MKTLKLGIYQFDKTDTGFDIYTKYKNMYDLDGKSPLREFRYVLRFTKHDDGKLYWSVVSRQTFKTVDAEKVPKTIAQLAHAVHSGTTIFEF